MLKENFEKATKGEGYKVLETYHLTYVYGDINIFVDIFEQFYIGIEGQYDRGMLFFEYWKIQEASYKAFKSPNLASLKKLLSVKFFESTLFELFIQKEENLRLVHQILEGANLPKIENHAVKSWFEKKRKTTVDSKIFKDPALLGEFELPEVVHASQFKDDNILALDVLSLNEQENKYQIQKCLLDIHKKEVITEAIIDMSQGLPFFTFAKDYPIESVQFGDKLQFTAKVVEAKDGESRQKVVLLKGSQKLYEYEYPKAANLGRFWVFNQKTTTDAFKNSVLFMYSIRDHTSEEDYFVLRFEAKKDQIIPMTKVLTKGDSIISFSPNGRMVYSATKEGGRRSKQVKIVQL